MGKLRLLLLIVITFNFVACSETNEDEIGGSEITQQFLEDYSGSYIDEESGERITISRDGEIEVLKHRQVGEADNPAIPRPTYCSFSMQGQVAYVVQLAEDRRLRTADDGSDYYIPRTHNLVFSVNNIAINDDLRSDSTSNQGCQNFQEQMNQKLPVYTYGLELFGSGTLRLHTQDDGDYQGGERTDSTLDEVFIRDSF